MLWLLALFLAFAPGALLLWYIRRIDKYEPEPWNMMGLAFLAGCISVIPALVLEMLFAVNDSSFVGTMIQAFLIVAVVEEGSKGALGYAFMWRKPHFNEVMDGIVYFGLAHMGFAITENLSYVFLRSGGNVAQALMTGFMRTTTAVPLHVVNGMIMGYHMGMAKFASTPSERRKHFLQAFLIPIALHGVYDLAAFNDVKVNTLSDLLRAGFGTALLYAAVVALWLFLIPRVKAAQAASPWKPQEWPTLPIAPTVCPNCGSVYPVGANYCHICATAVAQQVYYQPQDPGAQQPQG